VAYVPLAYCNSKIPANRCGESLRIGRCSSANARASGSHRARRWLRVRTDVAVEASREKASYSLLSACEGRISLGVNQVG
jgi:hypothetical protein